jgi:hypothetical protein
MSNTVDDVSDTSMPSRTFRSLARLARQRGEDEMRDLDDESLARCALASEPAATDEVRWLACLELLRRCELQMVRHASQQCRRIGNRNFECFGLRCPCLPGCHGVLEAALADFATRLTGDDYLVDPLAPRRGQPLFIQAPPRRGRQRSSSNNTLTRWCERPLNKRNLGLVPFLVGELGLNATTDVRRRWNANRGLRVRPNVPSAVLDQAVQGWQAQAQLGEQLATFGATGAALARQAATNPAGAVKKLINMLYDDACEASNHRESVIDVDRLARYLGAPTNDTAGPVDGDAPLPHDLGAFLDTFDALISEASQAASSSFYADHFDTARASRPQAPCVGRS